MKYINNKKGAGPIGSIILFIMFVVMYFMFIGGWVSGVGQRVVIDNKMVGVEAFFYLNLNLWIILIMLLGMIAWSYFGGQQ